jgi:DNA-binding NarL/FixJ family response regulator
LARTCPAFRRRGGTPRRLGDPGSWLAEAAEGFERHGLGELAARCTAIASPPTGRWAGLGITSREAEVLGLVADGLANKQIAERLTLSVRTVEKHMESLLRKTGCASRTQLVALVRS